MKTVLKTKFDMEEEVPYINFTPSKNKIQKHNKIDIIIKKKKKKDCSTNLF